MKVFNDSRTGLLMGRIPGDCSGLAPADFVPTQESLSGLIVSHSGWRRVFAESGDEEDPTPEIGPSGSAIAACMAEAYARYLLETTSYTSPRIAVGMDSRPTGRAIADAMLRVFLSYNFQVDFCFVCAAPEIMAVTRRGNPQTLPYAGFCYITASHNPVGHNGVKFGLHDGSVIGGNASRQLMATFWDNLRNISDANTPAAGQLLDRYLSVSDSAVEDCFSRVAELKKHSLAAYGNFTEEVATAGKNSREISSRIRQIRQGISDRQAGIVIDFNGSARAASIDRDFLGSLGLKIRHVNDRTGTIAHRIVPEGKSLDTAIALLEEAHAEDPSFVFGCVPDNDGDRGNLVFFDEDLGRVRPMEAQEVFALVVAAELAWMGYLDSKLPASQLRAQDAVVVNCATSLRIDEIARAFGARLAIAEVGEANVVGLASTLREEGYRVRVLGEGSNGGNITHPSAVRDPLNTICSVIKVLAVPEVGKIIAERLGRPGREIRTITDMISVLPVYTSTSAYEDRAIMRIETTDHALLKSEYERIFLAEWPEYRAILEPYGLSSWQELNTEGTECRSGFGAGFRTGTQRGGLKIQFKDREARPRAFIWMRGSGTEPVFRILADVYGANPELEEKLLAWQRSMIQRADAVAKSG